MADDDGADEVLLMAALKASEFRPEAKERQQANYVDRNVGWLCVGLRRWCL